MTHFQGFKTKKEAQNFIKENGRGYLCYQKSDIEKRGRLPEDYEDCVRFGGLSREYPYAVCWRESQM